MSVRFFSLTDCLYIAVALQRCMDDPSFVRIHRFQNYRFSGFLYLEGDSSCKVLQSFLTTASVVLGIEFYTNVGRLAFVYHKACQILKRIQCLASFSDEDTHILTFKIHIQRTVCSVVFRCDLHFSKIHGAEYITKKYDCSLLNLSDLLRIAEDLYRSALLRCSLTCFLRLTLLWSSWLFLTCRLCFALEIPCRSFLWRCCLCRCFFGCLLHLYSFCSSPASSPLQELLSVQILSLHPE